MLEALSVKQARRLALVSAGLHKPRRNGLPSRAKGRGPRVRRAALALVRHFGYLQLDTVSVAGARSHSLVLLSRLQGFDPAFGEDLLQPGQPIFEYWGHEASWLPIELYPYFEFRRRRFSSHPWWGDLLREHKRLAHDIVHRIEHEGPLRSIDLEGTGSSGWWNLKLSKKVATALWSSGRLAIRKRRSFQRTYDLAERVIPEAYRLRTESQADSLKHLLLVALRGHGWATTGTLASTWRLRNLGTEIKTALSEMMEEGQIASCAVRVGDHQVRGWIRLPDRELASALGSSPPPSRRAILLSPFDPLLWDRERVLQLFGFHQVLEIFKPQSQRIYGYYCLPILLGDRFLGRCDLKADRRAGRLRVQSLHFEDPASARDRASAERALETYADSLGLALAEADGSARQSPASRRS